MRNRLVVLLAIVAGIVVLGTLFYLARNPQQQDVASSSSQSSPTSARDGEGNATAPGTQSSTAGASASVEASIDNLFARLQSGEATDADVEALRQQLLAADPARATAAIRAFLATGKDIPTREEFMIGEGGILTGAPTVRTLLLDVLGRISQKTKNGVAAEISRQVLEKKDSPDEWAVAMRNVGWNDPKAKPYLASKVREMLTYEPWVLQPSPGFLESFDVVVYSADPEFIPDMTKLLHGESEELRRASAVALDRLSGMAPLEVMNYLNTHPSELADRPFLRADYYAKADLGNPAQQQALEAYLARGDVTLAEKTKLLKALATPASFVSDNLLTPAPPPDEDDSAHQQQLSQTLDQWMKQNRFPELQGEMAQIRQRLGQ